MEETNQVKRRTMALDYVPVGDIEEQKNHKGKITVPEGVTNQMIYKDIVLIAWPSLIELLLTQLASMVDMMMVGKLGSTAISAVGLTVQPKFLLMTAFMALNVGVTAMVARYKGAGEPEKAKLILRQGVLMTLVLTSIMSILGFIFSEKLIALMGAPTPESLHGGTVYLQIQMAGFLFLALTSTITAALRGVGDSKTAMIYNIIANVVNVIFNYFLIYGKFGFPRMELAGASLATVIGQTVAFILASIIIIRGKGYLKLEFNKSFKPDFKALKAIFQIGIPSAIEQLLMRFGMIVYTRTVAGLGDVAYATHHVCMSIQALSFMVGQGFAVSATSLVGQSLGKKRTDMAELYSKRTSAIGYVGAFILTALFLIAGKEIVMLYTNEVPVIETGTVILRYVAFLQPFQCMQFILAGALRGAGDTTATAVITAVTMMIIRPVMALVLINVFGLGLTGAWFALIADQVVRSLLIFARYKTGKWKFLRIAQ
jgi:putative MATE family efflux protein